MRKLRFLSFAVLVSLATQGSAENWVRVSSDSWWWIDHDSAQRADDGLIHFVSAIGCNAEGTMPATPADGVTSPSQCAYARIKEAANCSSGELFIWKEGFNDPDAPEFDEPSGWQKQDVSPETVLAEFPCS